MTDPPAVSEAVKLAGGRGHADFQGPVAAGIWVRIDEGTVNPPAPAVVVQMNDVEVLPEEVPPMISTDVRGISSGPGQRQARTPIHRRGKPPVTTSGEPMVIEVLNPPTSLPPAPFKE